MRPMFHPKKFFGYKGEVRVECYLVWNVVLFKICQLLLYWIFHNIDPNITVFHRILENLWLLSWANSLPSYILSELLCEFKKRKFCVKDKPQRLSCHRRSANCYYDLDDLFQMIIYKLFSIVLQRIWRCHISLILSETSLVWYRSGFKALNYLRLVCHLHKVQSPS